MTGVSVTSEVWPNLFVVGAAKAGTTSLWRYLDEHPEIWMAPVKEPNFFSGVRHPLNPDVVDEASYLRLFAPGARGELRGEAEHLLPLARRRSGRDRSASALRLGS